TSGRDYSSIAAWEADLDNAAIYASGDHAVGEVYNDSALINDAVTLDGGGTVGLASITLRPAVGHGHDGTKGTGARIVLTTTIEDVLRIIPSAIPITVEGIEIDCNDQNVRFA